MKKIFKFLWKYIGWLYFPIYILFWVLHKVARLILAISYFGMLEKSMAKDIVKWHGRY